jgi:hypothetical protein
MVSASLLRPSSTRKQKQKQTKQSDSQKKVNIKGGHASMTTYLQAI